MKYFYGHFPSAADERKALVACLNAEPGLTSLNLSLATYM